MLSLRFTNLNKVVAGLAAAGEFVESDTMQAVSDSLDMIETESKRRTPVDTGRLKASIGNPSLDGIREMREGQGITGTNVRYAAIQHEGYFDHPVSGERRFMSKGLKAAWPYVQNRMRGIVSNLPL